MAATATVALPGVLLVAEGTGEAATAAATAAGGLVPTAERVRANDKRDVPGVPRGADPVGAVGA